MSEFSVNAPKDAVDRKGVYILMDTLIEATKRQDGTCSQEIYLDSGRLQGKLAIIGGISDFALCNQLVNLQREDGFYKLVKGLGVSISAPDDPDLKTVPVIWKHYGKHDRYGRGTTIRFDVPADGGEFIYMFDQVQWDEDDDVIGNITFILQRPGQLAEVNVRLFVDDALEVPSGERDSKVERESEAYKSMIRRSLVSTGTDGRLRRAIERAKAGEHLTVAYIGGSITQGAGAKPINTNCYSYQSFLGITERLGDPSRFSYVKAGAGGTSSEFGLMRYTKEICLFGERKPDIVFIEFAVNDYDDETRGRCFESLLRTALSAENHPAVILLFSVFANNENLQDRLIPIGTAYGVPMVSVKNAVVPQFDKPQNDGRVISKRQYFYDTFHPTNMGHIVMSDCLLNLFDVVLADAALNGFSRSDASLAEDYAKAAACPCYGPTFDGIKLLERADVYPDGICVNEGSFTEKDPDLQYVERDLNVIPTPEFADNWKRPVGAGPEPFELKLSARTVFLVFKDSGSASTGKAVVTVNGTEVFTADPHINGWTHCNVKLLAESKERTEYVITVAPAPGDEAKDFTILGFGYTE